MLIVHQLSLQLVSVVHRDVMPQARVNDPELADQLARAVRSTPLNIAEGSGYGRSRRQKHHFRVALGSGREVFTCLELLVATGAVPAGSAHEARALSDRVNKMLYGLTARAKAS
ncbi:MAG: four helix bundle protein [Deltaproteobacteria bacterium]|nr:four helix bundle protein [Deltaproteobacteria bacterium]